MQHNRIKYQENLAQEFGKNKIEIPSKTLDEDLRKKIKKLEGSKNKLFSDENKKDDGWNKL